MLVCGLGSSVNSLKAPERFRTIGVNDIGRSFTPDYLFVMDPPASFDQERLRFIRESKASSICSYFDMCFEQHDVIRFSLRSSESPRLDDSDALYYTGHPCTSPFLAICLAAHLGAKMIGVIGVDYVSGQFSRKGGESNLAAELSGIDLRFYLLGCALLEKGVKVFNLSNVSRLSAFPKIDIDEFYLLQESRRYRSWPQPLRRYCIRSDSPVSNELSLFVKQVNIETPLSCRLIAPRSFDIELGSTPDIEAHILANSALGIDDVA